MLKESKFESEKGKLVSRKEFLVGSGAVIAAIALTACGKTTSSTTPSTSTLTPKYGGVLRFITNSAFLGGTIGWPADPMGNMGATFPQCCLETLLHGDNKGGIYPWLAESYKIAEDMKSATFILRKEVKFHDGSDLNAEVVKWNLDNYINAKMEPNWASVDIVDDYTIRANFAAWVCNMPASFGDAGTMAVLVSKAAFDKNGLEWVKRNPVGTGPFKFASYNQDVSMNFVKNPDYWIKGKPYLDGIEYIIVNDEGTQKMLMETGEADTMHVDLGKMTADMAAIGMTLKVDKEITKILVPDTANADSPWADQKVREAVEYAIDREAIAKALGYGYLQAAYQIPPRYALTYDPNFALARKYNIEKAKQLLSEAGHPDGFKTTIIATVDRDVVTAIQAELAKVGIQADLEFPQAGLWMTYLNPGTWPKNAALYMPAPAIDVYSIGGLQFTIDRIGTSWLRTPEMTQAYHAALATSVPDVGLIRAVTDMISKDASLIPIIEGGGGRAERPYVIAADHERGTPAIWNPEDAWLNK